MITRFLLQSSSKVLNTYYRKMSKSALVLLAPGSEEMELVISIDVLRRAGIKVTVAGVTGSEPAKCSRDVVVAPDTSLTEAVKSASYDVVLLPGGLDGAKAFAESAEVGLLLKEQEKSGKLVAAICAAPTALKAHGIGLGKKLTAYPSVKDQLSGDYDFVSQKVVVDGNLLTSQGPGTAFDFALSVAEQLVGAKTVQSVKEGLLLA